MEVYGQELTSGRFTYTMQYKYTEGNIELQAQAFSKFISDTDLLNGLLKECGDKIQPEISVEVMKGVYAPVKDYLDSNETGRLAEAKYKPSVRMTKEQFVKHILDNYKRSAEGVCQIIW